MKKKGNVLVNILIFLAIVIGIFLEFLIFYKKVDIDVKEISMMQERFYIENNNPNFFIEDENGNVQDDVNPNQNVDVEDDDSGNNGGSSGTTRKNNKSSSGRSYSGSSSGSGATVGEYTSGGHIPKIYIPRTGINYTIYTEVSASNMERGVVVISTVAGLNQPGNTVISGHNTLNGRLFSRNDRIQEGDIIYISDEDGDKLAYSVYDKYIADATDASYIERDTQGEREISLTTCTDDQSQRLIILARET